MKRLTIRRLKDYVLIFLLVLLAVSALKIYNDKEEEKRQYESFLNTLYFELNSAVYVIDLILSFDPETDTNETLTNLLISIENDLDRIVLVIELGNHWVDKDIYPNSFHLGVFKDREYSPVFAEDGVLDKSEQLFLETLRNELESIREGMYSEETRQENPNLTIEQLNKLISEVVSISNSELSN